MTDILSKRVALNRIISTGVEPILLPAEFQRAGRTTWVRHRAELDHVVALVAHYDSRIIQWGVVSPEAVDFVWGRPPKGIDVGDSVMTGSPGSIRHPPACELFQLQAENDSEQVATIAAAVAVDLQVIEERLRGLATRRQLRSYLLENRKLKDARFIVPSSLSLKLYVVAVLAALDHDPQARDLAVEAEENMQPWIRDPLIQRRLNLLKAALNAI